jgi:hypothetical protein
MASVKKSKDPNAPKRALSGCATARVAQCSTSRALRYSLFVKQSSAGIRAATPGINAVEVMKACGAKWQSLTPEEKADWNSKCKQQ